MNEALYEQSNRIKFYFPNKTTEKYGLQRKL